MYMYKERGGGGEGSLGYHSLVSHPNSKKPRNGPQGYIFKLEGTSGTLETRTSVQLMVIFFSHDTM